MYISPWAWISCHYLAFNDFFKLIFSWIELLLSCTLFWVFWHSTTLFGRASRVQLKLHFSAQTKLLKSVLLFLSVKHRTWLKLNVSLLYPFHNRQFDTAGITLPIFYNTLRFHGPWSDNMPVECSVSTSAFHSQFYN